MISVRILRIPFSMAVVAVPFILYLVRFCSSKSCKYSVSLGVGNRGIHHPPGVNSLLFATFRLCYGSRYRTVAVHVRVDVLAYHRG